VVTSWTQDLLVDIDSPETWPPAAGAYVAELAAAAGEAPYVSDLRLPDYAEGRVRELLRGRRLTAFHATRLLDHERDMISFQGLCVFGRTLFENRINAALDQGALSATEHQALLGAHMYAVGEEHKRGLREGQVCLILGRSLLANHVHAVSPLLSTWGGEGIYFSSGATELRPLLTSLGRPTIIRVAIQVHADNRAQRCSPGLSNLLVGRYRRLKDVHGDVFHRASIPPHNVLEIWQPGDAAYDAFPELPQQ
jgi:hypothetical protein